MKEHLFLWIPGKGMSERVNEKEYPFELLKFVGGGDNQLVMCIVAIHLA